MMVSCGYCAGAWFDRVGEMLVGRGGVRSEDPEYGPPRGLRTGFRHGVPGLKFWRGRSVYQGAGTVFMAGVGRGWFG